MTSLKSLATLAGIIGALFASGLAQADEPFVNPDWANSAWYVGAGVGRSRATIDEQRLYNSLLASGATSVAFSKNERDEAYKLYVGKQLNRNFALEMGYFDLGHFGFNATTVPGGALNGQASFRGLNLDLLAELPLSERVSLYARLGAQYARTHTTFSGNRLFAVTSPNQTTNKFNGKAGAGIEFKLTEALALRGEVERYRLNDAVGNRGDVDLLSVNLVYKFGRPAAARPAPAPEPMPEPKAAPVAIVTPAAPPPPPPPAPVVVSEKVSFSAKALFDFDKSVVKPEGRAALDTLLVQLQGMNTEVMITVGHTDSVGTNAYNEKLSLRRAEAVKAYLVSKGVDATRVYTEGKGETQPVADNKTADGRAANRRVTVEVVGTRTPK